MHANDNARHHVILETDLAGRELPIRAPLPEPPMYICTAPGETLMPAEREAVERFFAYQRRMMRTGRRRAA